jgi:hypothetical protein
MHILRLALFATFVALLLAVRISRWDRRAVNALIVYVLGVLILLAAVGREAWPFSRFPMMANDARLFSGERVIVAVRLVDRTGREWQEDPLGWSPLYPQALRGWFENVFDLTTPAERREVGRFLLDRANKARFARSHHRDFGNERLLGAFAAPDTYAYSRDVPAATQPYAGIRVYALYWHAAGSLRGTTARRRLLLEYFQ